MIDINLHSYAFIRTLICAIDGVNWYYTTKVRSPSVVPEITAPYKNMHTRIWKRGTIEFIPSFHQLVMNQRTFYSAERLVKPIRWRHNDRDGVSNHRRLDCLPDRLSRRRSKKTSKLRVTGLCEGNSPVTDEFPEQMASNAENVSIWWRHHAWMA